MSNSIDQEQPVRRGCGHPPGLRKLLTQKFPDGTNMNDLIGAGFTGEIKSDLDAGDVAMNEDGVYRWIGKPVEKPAAEAKSSGEVVQYVPIAEIKIGERYRKDLGNIGELAESILSLGLLQPIGITADKLLIFGERRIEAAKALGETTIAARIIPIKDIRQGEHDENECRLNFTVSERVAILQAIGRKPVGN